MISRFLQRIAAPSEALPRSPFWVGGHYPRNLHTPTCPGSKCHIHLRVYSSWAPTCPAQSGGSRVFVGEGLVSTQRLQRGGYVLFGRLQDCVKIVPFLVNP